MHKPIMFRDTQLQSPVAITYNVDQFGTYETGRETLEETPAPHMFLIYPGMTDFEEVEITRETAEPGYCYVRPMGADEIIKVSISRLVDRETAISRTHTTIIERHDDMGTYYVTEKSVTA